MSRHRIGIVGTGGIAHAHIQGYRTVAGDLGDVVAGCDPDADRLAAYCDQHDVPLRFSNASDLIDSGEVDIIALLTPPAVRAEVIEPACNAGIHMLVEKPFGERYADARSFTEMAERAPVKMAINHELRFNRDVLALRDAIAAGRLGDILSVVHDHYYDRRNTRGWRADVERLEIAIFSIHVIDRIQWLAGVEPVAVTAMTRHWIPTVRGESFTALTIEFERDIVGSMVSSWNANRLPECRLRVDGTAGSALSLKDQVAGDSCELLIHTDDGELERLDMGQENAFVTSMGESMRRLLLAVDSGSEPDHSARDNLKTMAIMDAAYLSASRGGARVEISEVTA